MTVVEPVAERRDELAAEHPGLRVVAAPEPGLLDDAGERLAGAVLAVKPDVAEGACRALGVTGVTRVLSIVAGMPAARLEAALGGEPAVVRAMPNTPALVGAGRDRHLGRVLRHLARPGLGRGRARPPSGTVVRLPERLLDAVTGLSGSGPAYFFLVAEALMEAGVQMGLTREVSRTLVVETMAGSAALLKETGQRARGAARHGDLAGGHDGGGHPDARGPGGALGLHGGGGGGHGTLAQPVSAERSRPRRPMPSEPARTVFFLSDFGTQDEFAGVVHAVIAARAPGTTVIDLTHHIPPFDVRAGSHTLVRAVPHLGPGVVLGVVDPGVGTARRGICLEVPLPAGGTLYFVGPDNGLLVAAAEAAGEAPDRPRGRAAPGPQPPPDQGATFDGRDLFAPAAAALCAGHALPRSSARPWTRRRWCASSAAWSSRDGCTTAGPACAPRSPGSTTSATCSWRRPWPTRASPGSRSVGSIELAARIESGREYLDGLPHSLVPDGVALRCVDAFGDLKQGEFGLLVDANGHLAVVAGEASAASWLNVAAGELLVLAW